MVLVTEGLRERKKARTRKQIQDSALRLFAAQGYEATTVEQIAAAAEVSPSTFFRYYPTKEDVVLSDEFDPLILSALEAEPSTLSPVQAMRAVMGELLGELFRQDREVFRERIDLIYGTAALRARILDGIRETCRTFGAALARPRGLPEDDPDVQVAMSAILAVMTTTIEIWSTGGGKGDLPADIDRALALLETGLVLPARKPARGRRT